MRERHFRDRAGATTDQRVFPVELTLPPSALLTLLALLSGCAPSASVRSASTGPRAEPAAFSGRATPSPERPPSGRLAPALSAERSTTRLTPPEAAGALLPLPVPEHEPAVVVLPSEPRAARPVLVVTHGAGGSPEEHCSLYQAIVRGRGFILCPRGEPTARRLPPGESGFFYRDHRALEREVRAAFAALKEAYGDHVDARAPIYAGFSQGAIMGALFLPSRPVLFARGVFIEGGVGEYEEWTLATARAAAEGAGAGHTYGGAVGDAIVEALPCLLEGDDRWSSP